MIKLNPLYLLVLIELSCILAGCLVFVLFRYKRYRILYRDAVKDLREVEQLREEEQKKFARGQEAAAAAGDTAQTAAEPGPASSTKEIDDLKAKLQEIEEELRQKNSKMQALQSKFADLEKEYMVLYQLQQSQQQEQPKVP